MTGEISAEEKNNFAFEMFSAAQIRGVIPDIGIDKSLLMFSGLNSTAVLEEYTSNTLSNLVPGNVSNLGSSLAAFNAVPNAVGLGALVISLLLDLTISSLVIVNSDNTLNMIRRVFAEEKALDLRDTMDEYMKRLGMFLQEPEQALEETKRLENQLSEQLTRLRNSMLTDDQMSSCAMKYWTNGAAFHLQMLAHEARLKMAGKRWNRNDLDNRVDSISSVADHYIKDLEELLKKYKSYKVPNMFFSKAKYFCTDYYIVVACTYKCKLSDRELGRQFYLEDFDKCKISSQEYVDYMFNNWRLIKELNEYFTVFKRNLRELIMQYQTFNLNIKG